MMESRTGQCLTGHERVPHGKKSDLRVVPSLLEFHSFCAAPPTVTPEQGLHIGKALGSHEGGERDRGRDRGEVWRGGVEREWILSNCIPV